MKHVYSTFCASVCIHRSIIYSPLFTISRTALQAPADLVNLAAARIVDRVL